MAREILFRPSRINSPFSLRAVLSRKIQSLASARPIARSSAVSGQANEQMIPRARINTRNKRVMVSSLRLEIYRLRSRVAGVGAALGETPVFVAGTLRVRKLRHSESAGYEITGASFAEPQSSPSHPICFETISHDT